MKCVGEEHMGCEGKGGPVELRSRMTAYHWSEASQAAGEPDPNAPIALCESCWEDYSQCMKSQWDEHNHIIHEGIVYGHDAYPEHDNYTSDDDYDRSFHFSLDEDF